MTEICFTACDFLELHLRMEAGCSRLRPSPFTPAPKRPVPRRGEIDHPTDALGVLPPVRFARVRAVSI